MRALATMTCQFLFALAIIAIPGSASATLFGDVVEGLISNGEADPNAILTQFSTPTATVSELGVEFKGATCVSSQVPSSFGIAVDVHGESFTVAITNQGPDRAEFTDVSMFNVTLSSLNWVGAPEGFVAGVSNDINNPSEWQTSFEPHLISVLCDGSGQGVWANQETREWTFQIQTGGHATGARIVNETCEANSSGVIVTFGVENINLPDICAVTMQPTGQPPAEGCKVQSCSPPNGWSCALNVVPNGAAWEAISLPDCISTGTIKSNFKFFAPFEPGGCCYTFRYYDGSGAFLFEEEHCFECEPPVQVAPTTWGAIKSNYR
jgi:hypothetical protein